MSTHRNTRYHSSLGPKSPYETQEDYRIRMLSPALEALLVSYLCDRLPGMGKTSCEVLRGLLIGHIQTYLKVVEPKESIS